MQSYVGLPEHGRGNQAYKVLAAREREETEDNGVTQFWCENFMFGGDEGVIATLCFDLLLSTFKE